MTEVVMFYMHLGLLICWYFQGIHDAVGVVEETDSLLFEFTGSWWLSGRMYPPMEFVFELMATGSNPSQDTPTFILPG